MPHLRDYKIANWFRALPVPASERTSSTLPQHTLPDYAATAFLRTPALPTRCCRAAAFPYTPHACRRGLLRLGRCRTYYRATVTTHTAAPYHLYAYTLPLRVGLPSHHHTTYTFPSSAIWTTTDYRGLPPPHLHLLVARTHCHIYLHYRLPPPHLLTLPTTTPPALLFTHTRHTTPTPHTHYATFHTTPLPFALHTFCAPVLPVPTFRGVPLHCGCDDTPLAAPYTHTPHLFPYYLPSLYLLWCSRFPNTRPTGVYSGVNGIYRTRPPPHATYPHHILTAYGDAYPQRALLHCAPPSTLTLHTFSTDATLPLPLNPTTYLIYLPTPHTYLTCPTPPHDGCYTTCTLYWRCISVVTRTCLAHGFIIPFLAGCAGLCDIYHRCLWLSSSHAAARLPARAWRCSGRRVRYFVRRVATFSPHNARTTTRYCTDAERRWFWLDILLPATFYLVYYTPP